MNVKTPETEVKLTNRHAISPIGGVETLFAPAVD